MKESHPLPAVAALIHAETLELLEWPRLCQHLSTFAATKLGALAARHLQIPTTPAATECLLAETREIDQLEGRLAVVLKFEGIEDIGDALERAALGGVLAGSDLLAIATTLAAARSLRRTIEDQENLPCLQQRVAELRTYPEVEQEIYRCLDERGRVSDRASPKLARIREQQRQVRDQIYDRLQQMLQRQASAIQEAVITQRQERFVIPVKATHKDAVPGIVHDTSTSGSTLYIEPNATVAWNNQLRQLLRQEQAEDEVVRRQLTQQVAAVSADLERLLAICTSLDLAAARARYSYWLGANPPTFTPSPSEPTNPSQEGCQPAMVLRHLRHPLLVWQHQHEQGPEVVPIDVIISPQIRVVAITGPNTGGKTVTLKTLGLVALMAKVGLFVPAREPVELPWFEQVLADIGDEQSLQQSLSTFSGHVRRISRILSALQSQLETDRTTEGLEHDRTGHSSNSLVLLDEVGAGTDPSEGSALAIALLQYLADHAALTIATTHFGELKALKYEDQRFENASVEFDEVSLSPTYRLLWGIPGRSNALTIARRLGLNPMVVQAAQEYVGGEREAVNQVIAGLEAQRRQQQEKSEEAGKLLKQAEFLYEQVSRKAEKLRQRERQLQQQQEVAVQAAIAEARAEVAQVIRRLQQGTPTAQDAHQATTQLGQLAQQYLPSRQAPPPPKPGFQPQVGDRVRIPRLGQTAEVLAVAEDGDEVTVRFGLMKMTIAIEEIESLQGEKVQKPTPPPTAPTVLPPQPAPLIRTAGNTIDLRGSRVMDAEVMLDRSIAAADSVLWIIHGHGTGKLRQGVHEFLQRHPRIERFELAPREEGGAGVTIAYLRG
jgi:DNA mismatch repair protein MutS2